jgi:hypothetical protein
MAFAPCFRGLRLTTLAKSAGITSMTPPNGTQALVGILLLSGAMPVIAGEQILEWKMGSAVSSADGGVTLMDGSGHGFELCASSSAISGSWLQ